MADAGKGEKGLGELRERIRVSYHERSDRESYPSLRDIITQSGRVKRFKEGVRRKTMTDFVNVRISKTTPLSGRILDDPLTLQGTVLLRILARRVPEQHFLQKDGKRKKNRASKREDKGEYLFNPLVAIIKGRVLEFKCKRSYPYFYL